MSNSPVATENPGAALAAQVERFGDVKILCLGDLMLDRFIYGSVERISPEAPIPVFTKEREQLMLGGAGNVVRNILSLGASCSFLSVVGNDRVGRELTNLVAQEKKLVPYLITEQGRISTKKTRYVAGNQQLLRSDEETREPLTADSEQQLIQLLEEEIPNHHLVILSDYGKGTLTPTLVKRTIELAEKAGIRVIVDPKQRDFSLYRGAYLVSPNLRELEAAASTDILNDKQVVMAAQRLMQKHGIRHMLVTRSKDGMTLVRTEGDVEHLPAKAREIYDVSGAGDTAIATLGVALAAGLALPEAAFISNIAAGIVVGKLGTAVVYRTDLKTAIYTHDMVTSQSKILPLSLAIDQVSNWRRDGYKVGFTNGCFDIMHSGHLSLLQQARGRCDRLVLGLNSDESVKRLKGEERPVNSEMDRAMLLAALTYVDMVVIFRDDTPIALIEALKPEVLMKGADYTKDQVVGADIVEAYGGEVELIPLKEGYSTTATIAKMSGQAS